MHRFFRTFGLPVAVLAAVAAALGGGMTRPGGAPTARAATAAVTISDFQFTPATVTVNQGDTVTWTNNGPSIHTATSDTGVWDSGVLNVGASYSYTFSTPGTYAYHCSIHPSMLGTVIVTAATTSTPTASPAASATPSPTPSPTASPTASPTQPPAQAPDFAQFGFPTVGGSVQLAAGQGGTVAVGDQSVTIDPGTFAVPVTFELLVGSPSSFASLVEPDDQVIATFAFRVTGPNGRIGLFSKPVHYTLTGSAVSPQSEVYNTTATSPITAVKNPVAAVVQGDALTHNFIGAGVGWFVTTPKLAGTVTAPNTGHGPSSAGAEWWWLAIAGAAIVVGGTGTLVLARRRAR